MRNNFIIKIFFSVVFIIYNPSAKILTLGEAEHKAVTMGFDVRAQYFKEESKAWEKKNVIGNYLPSINYDLTYYRMDKETVDNTNFGFAMFFPEGVPNPNKLFYDNLTHKFSISQPISNGGVEIIAIKIAKHLNNIVKLEHNIVGQNSAYTTRKAYFNTLAAQERTKVVRHDLSWTIQNLNKAKIKHEAGSTPITDVLQWEAEVSKNEATLLEAEATEIFMMLNLYQSMGIDKDNINDFDKLQPFETFVTHIEKGPIETNETIEDNRQLKIIKEYTIVADKQIKIARSNYLPKLNGFYNFNYNQYWDKTKSELTDNQKRRSWTAGVQLNVPLFSGFKTPTNFKKVKNNYNKTLVEEQKVEAQLKVNLERIKLFYKASHGSVKAAKKQQKLMNRQLDIMQERYDGGLVNQSQLLEVSIGTKLTRIGYIQKVLECLLYEAEYHKNVGKLEVTK